MAASVVLVPGAWHGAWCFDEVRAGLEEAGVRAVAVDLPGHGLDGGALADLHGDAARVCEVLDGEPPGTLLVGHSYGGAVVTEAGRHPHVGHIAYICAFALDAHESCIDAAGEAAAAAHLSHEGRPDLAAAIIDRGDGSSTLEPGGAAACFFNDCDPARTAWAVARLEPHHTASLGQQPAAVAWRERPSTYVICTEDQAVHPGLQRLLAERCGRTVSWPTGHSPFLSRPDLVIGLLTELARA